MVTIQPSFVTIQPSIDFSGITCMTGRVLAEWGRGPISSFAAMLSGKIWHNVKNIAESKGLSPLAGSGAEPRLNSYVQYRTPLGFYGLRSCTDPPVVACGSNRGLLTLNAYGVPGMGLIRNAILFLWPKSLKTRQSVRHKFDQPVRQYHHKKGEQIVQNARDRLDLLFERCIQCQTHQFRRIH